MPSWGLLLTEFCLIGFHPLSCEVAGWGLPSAWEVIFLQLGIILEILKQVFLWHLNLIELCARVA